jgi:hypothetical protein
LLPKRFDSRLPSSWRIVVALYGFAVFFYVIVGLRSGNLTHLGSTVFSSVDAGTYRQVADWIYGSGPKTAAVAQRPFLYPVILGLADRVGGPGAVWFLNFLLWLAAINITSLAVQRFVQRTWAAVLVFLLMATNISLIVLTFHALAETLAVALLAAWALGLTLLSKRIEPVQAVWALLPLTLLVVVKPEFELLLVLMVLVVVVLSARSRQRAVLVGVIAVCLVPVSVQLGLMATVNHYMGLSVVGDDTIRYYFMARLYASIAHSSDILGQRQVTGGLTTGAMLRVIGSHPLQTVVVLGSTLRENLLSGSNFVGGSNPTLGKAIVLTNYVYAAALVVMVPLATLAIWTRRDGRLILLCAGILNVLLSGSLSFWQGDRLTVIALPLLLVALALAVAQARPLLGRLSWQRRALTRKAA